MKQLKVVLIGAGGRGVAYAENIKLHPEKFDLVGIAEPIKKRRDDIKSKFNLSEDDKFTIEHVNFIKSYMADVMDLFGEDLNWSLLCDLIDVKSFAENYIIEELFHNSDVGFSSFYMYKEKNGKLYAGPVWDFDMSAGLYFDTISDNFFDPEDY